MLHALDPQQALELLLDKLKKTRSNVEFLMQIQKTTLGPPESRTDSRTARSRPALQGRSAGPIWETGRPSPAARPEYRTGSPAFDHSHGTDFEPEEAIMKPDIHPAYT